MINYIFISFSAVQIYELSYIHLYSSPSMGSWCISDSQSGQLPAGLIVQLLEHCTGIAEVMGLNPVQAWLFFSVFNFTTAVVVCITVMINHTFVSFSAVQIIIWTFIYSLVQMTLVAKYSFFFLCFEYTWNYILENVGNGISELPKLKISWRSCFQTLQHLTPLVHIP